MSLRCSHILVMCLENLLSKYHRITSCEFSETRAILHRKSIGTDLVMIPDVYYSISELLILVFQILNISYRFKI